MRRQRGVTMIGWIFLLVPMAIVPCTRASASAPIYLNYWMVDAMKKTGSELKSDETLSATPSATRSRNASTSGTSRRSTVEGHRS